MVKILKEHSIQRSNWVIARVSGKTDMAQHMEALPGVYESSVLQTPVNNVQKGMNHKFALIYNPVISQNKYSSTLQLFLG